VTTVTASLTEGSMARGGFGKGGPAGLLGMRAGGPQRFTAPEHHPRK
jgi:hypothetical protein